MSNIKERVLLIAEYKKIRKTDFFKDLGLSYANFKGVQKSTALNSDAVATILSRYPDISPEWLVTGHGNMFREGGLVVREQESLYGEPIVVNELEPTLIEVLKLLVSSQEKTILSLEKQITILEEEVAKTKK